MQVALDEGGIRHVEEGAYTYVPYAAIADVELVTRMLRAPVVAIELATGEKRTIFSGSEALEIHRAIVEHLEARRQRKSVQVVPRWQRQGRALDAWLADARTGEGYRDETLATALSIFDDADADIEERAAAGHVLVHAGELRHVARVVASRSLPPLVLGVLGVADDDAKRFLGEPMPDDDGKLARMIEQARLEPSPGEEPPKHHARHHRAVAGADRNPGKWVGKTWGF